MSPASEGPSQADFSSVVLSRLASQSPAQTRYEIEGEVARGGMGAVLRVWDESLRRHLAMKVMLDQGGASKTDGAPGVNSRTLGRFLEEAQVTGQLDHPGIVPVHELGLDEQGRVYFTMKLVKGKTLRDVFDELERGEGGWTQTRVLGLIQKVCDAMSYAHAKGVIHRDLKPANVMVGKYGEVYVMDWGLARVTGRDDERDIRPRAEPTMLTSEVRSERRDRSGSTPDMSLMTMDGDVVGTPAYMPPEQARGDLPAMGPHSDVYAVGAMLYHLLAGQMPYVPPDARLNNYAVWQRVQEGPPRPLHEVAPDVPAELAAICERAMAREASARYADMPALADDLSAYVEGRVVSAYETGAWAEARKWVQRNRPLAAALAAAVALLVLGLASSLLLKARAEARAAEVLQLSALQDLEKLLAEADELWPAYPHQIEGFRSWIAKAEALVAGLPDYRAKREELRALALPQPLDEHPEADWWNAQLTKLIDGLEGLLEEETGLLSSEGASPQHGMSIARRLDFARNLRRGFLEEGNLAQAWRGALPAIREAYPSLELKPQLGLLPIGPDPDTGLWEFAHLMTGTPAERGPDGVLELTEETGVVLVLLPEGSFWMGAQSEDPADRNYDPRAQIDEGPVHRVNLSPFFLSKYEMTQAQWKRVTGHNPSAWRSGDGIGQPPSGLNPVESLTWLDCMDWLPRLGLALPSEAQWEYGARGGTTTPWWTGSEPESLAEKHAANLASGNLTWVELQEGLAADDGFGQHAPVGTFSPNPFGLHDVAGNVWEWCEDRYDATFYERAPDHDPVATGETRRLRVKRGGSYNSSTTRARSSLRGFVRSPAFVVDDQGVRPARKIDG